MKTVSQQELSTIAGGTSKWRHRFVQLGCMILGASVTGPFAPLGAAAGYIVAEVIHDEIDC